jgi:hypothetical protein
MLPEGVVAGGRALVNASPKAIAALGRSTPGGQVLRREEAAVIAQSMPTDIFQPVAKAAVKQKFDLIKASGVQVETKTLQDFFNSIGKGKTEALLADMDHLDLINRTGGKYTDLVENILTTPKGTPVTGDISLLQDLRSEVRKLAESVDSAESKDLLHRFRYRIDEAIDNGAIVGPQTAHIPALLHEARREYAQLRASEDLAMLIKGHATTTPNLQVAQISPRPLNDELRRNRTSLAQMVNTSLDKTPGARERLQTALDAMGAQFSTIEMPMTDVAGLRRLPLIAGASQALSDILLSEPGRKLLQSAILKKPQQALVGVIPSQLLAVIANVIRRDNADTLPNAPTRQFSGVQIDDRQPGNPQFPRPQYIAPIPARGQ